jgi:SAM-dependent methyltransferase
MNRLFVQDNKNIKINIGGGQWYQWGWKNLDYYVDELYKDYSFDIRNKQKFPLADNSVLYYFSSHVFEHVSDDVAQFTFCEIFRTLKVGGVFRISVPDREKAFKAFEARDTEFFDNGGVTCVGETIERKLVNFFASYKMNEYSGGPVVEASVVREKFHKLNPDEFVNWCVSLIPAEAPYKAHVNGYDFNKLLFMLRQAGFSNVVKSDFRQSQILELRGKKFDNRPIVSLYVEAIK